MNEKYKGSKVGSGSGTKFDLGKPELSLMPHGFAVYLMASLKCPEYAKAAEFDALRRAFLRMSEYGQGCMAKKTKLLREALDYTAIGLGGKWKLASALADSMVFGKVKYSRNNWRGGFDDSRMLDASMRHCLQYLTGEEIDKDSGNDHRKHIPFGLAVMLDQHERRFYGENVGKDDVYV